jgi:hypothetical protein
MKRLRIAQVRAHLLELEGDVAMHTAKILKRALTDTLQDVLSAHLERQKAKQDIHKWTGAVTNHNNSESRAAESNDGNTDAAEGPVLLNRLESLMDDNESVSTFVDLEERL